MEVVLLWDASWVITSSDMAVERRDHRRRDQELFEPSLNDLNDHLLINLFFYILKKKITSNYTFM